MDNEKELNDFLKWLDENDIELAEEEHELIKCSFLGQSIDNFRFVRGCMKTPRWLQCLFQYYIEKGVDKYEERIETKNMRCFFTK